MERRGEEDLGDEPWVVVVVAAEQRWVDRGTGDRSTTATFRTWPQPWQRSSSQTSMVLPLALTRNLPVGSKVDAAAHAAQRPRDVAAWFGAVATSPPEAGWPCERSFLTP